MDTGGFRADPAQPPRCGALRATPFPQEGGHGDSTFGFADGGVVAAAALVVHTEGVTLALVPCIEAFFTAALTGVCKSHPTAQEE